MNHPELLLKNVWLMLRRAPRDRRTWRPLLVAFAAIAYVAYDIWAFFFLGIAGTLSWVVAMMLAIGLAVLLGRSYRRADESMLHLSARTPAPTEDLLLHTPRVLQTLFGTAALVDRAGAELMHRQGRVNAGDAGVVRRRTLDVARSSGWDQLTGPEQALLLAQEGSWSEADTWYTIYRVEQVRVLRWVLGIDAILMPLEFADLNLRGALEITTKPECAAGAGCLCASDLRGAKLLAGNLLDRLVAEGAYRGFYKVPKEGVRLRLLEIAERMHQPGAQDQLIGVDSVAEASEQRVRFVSQIALRRVLALGDVLGYLDGPAEAQLRLRGAGEESVAEALAG